MAPRSPRERPLVFLRYLLRLCTNRREASFFFFCILVALGLSAKKRRLKAQARQITRLKLIDPAWYRTQYPSLPGALLSPVLHYLREGYKQACNPNPLFNTRWYLLKYKRRIPKSANPLLHYIETGARQGLEPFLFFDTRAYRTQHPELENSTIPPLSHYLTHHSQEEILKLSVKKDDETFEDISANESPRIAIISHDETSPGHIYRVEMYARALASRGYNVRTLAIIDVKKHTEFLRTAAVIILWRTAWDMDVETVFNAARQGKAKIVFDIDDLQIEPQMAYGSQIDSLRFRNIRRNSAADAFTKMRQSAENADFCTAPTQPLVTALHKLGKPCFLLPNGFDEQTYRRTRQALAKRRSQPGDGLVRIGYAGGTRTHQKDFACAAAALARILKAHPEARLVLFRKQTIKKNGECLDPAEYPEFAGLESQIEWWPFRPLRELPGALARFDINLAPLEASNPFCEAKSELKYFEAALAEVPTIASPTIPYATAIRNGETGFLASDLEQWQAALELLIGNPAMRAKIGKAAFDDVYWRYGPERRAQLAGNAIEQILTSSAEKHPQPQSSQQA